MCCGKPSDPFALQIAALSVVGVGWIFSIVAVGTCEFAERKGKNGYSDVQGGLFSYNDDGDCKEWPSDASLDSAFEAAQAFGVMACLFGSLVLAAMVVSLFVRFPRWAWITLMSILFAVAPFQLITLSLFGSENCTEEFYELDDGCLPHAGAYSTLIAFACWLTGAILICRLPRLDKAIVNCGACCGAQPPAAHSGGGIYHTTVPAGSGAVAPKTKTITKEEIDANGVKTITTEIVPIIDQ